MGAWLWWGSPWGRLPLHYPLWIGYYHLSQVRGVNWSNQGVILLKWATPIASKLWRRQDTFPKWLVMVWPAGLLLSCMYTNSTLCFQSGVTCFIWDGLTSVKVGHHFTWCCSDSSRWAAAASNLLLLTRCCHDPEFIRAQNHTLNNTTMTLL